MVGFYIVWDWQEKNLIIYIKKKYFRILNNNWLVLNIKYYDICQINFNWL